VCFSPFAWRPAEAAGRRRPPSPPSRGYYPRRSRSGDGAVPPPGPTGVQQRCSRGARGVASQGEDVTASGEQVCLDETNDESGEAAASTPVSQRVADDSQSAPVQGSRVATGKDGRTDELDHRGAEGDDKKCRRFVARRSVFGIAHTWWYIVSVIAGVVVGCGCRSTSTVRRAIWKRINRSYLLETDKPFMSLRGKTDLGGTSGCDLSPSSLPREQPPRHSVYSARSISASSLRGWGTNGKRAS
jgi:hypothetical protein